MFFVLSKVLWFVTNPGNMLLLFLLLGMTLLWTRWRRAGRWLVSAVAVIGVTLAVFPFGGWLVGALEDRFPAVTTPPARVDGVIVAGGIVDPVLSDDRGQVSVGGAAERLFEKGTSGSAAETGPASPAASKTGNSKKRLFMVKPP